MHDINKLTNEVRQIIDNAIYYRCEERIGEVATLLRNLNDEPDIPIPGPGIFEALRLVHTTLSEAGIGYLAEMLQAIEEADDPKFALATANFCGDEDPLGHALAAVAFNPEDTGHEPETIAGCQRVIEQLAKKWNVTLPG